jgi:hypothetical protein
MATAADPCEIPLDTTTIAANGTRSVSTLHRPREALRPVDCFYVYPTVSNQVGPNATQTPSPEVVSETEYQAARFSSVCRMFVPLYRQVTVPSIVFNGIPGPPMNTAYADVLEAWQTYLAHDNDGRGFILIGHSQGSLLLRQLIRTRIDPDPSVRRRLVGATLLGGQVTTRAGQTTGGDFQNIPICTQRGESGCIVAYSTFPNDPTPSSLYGDSSTDNLSGAFGEPHGAGYEVACTEPGLLSGDTGSFPLTLPTAPFAPGFIASSIANNTGTVPSASTTWVSNWEYSGGCQTIQGHHVYRYDPVGSSRTMKEFPPGFGTHLLDFNLGPDRLVRIAALQIHAWLRSTLGVVTVRDNIRRGTASLTLRLPGAGTIVATAPGRIHPARASVTQPRRVTLPIVPTRAVARRLRVHRHQQVRLTVTYAFGNGQRISQSKPIQLVWR